MPDNRADVLLAPQSRLAIQNDNPYKTAMPTVSEQLRQARETQALTVEQVAEATKIKSDHVRALDDGNFEAFTAPVYIKGFVRSYSNLLKLDTASILASLEQELKH
jgi:cytoskeletal protein RodZ